jgi:phospholipid N-methyltransferase
MRPPQSILPPYSGQAIGRTVDRTVNNSSAKTIAQAAAQPRTTPLIGQRITRTTPLLFGSNSKAYAGVTPEDYLHMRHHAGWQAGVDYIAAAIQQLTGAHAKAPVLEMGPGAGNATELMAKRFPKTPLLAIELDTTYAHFLSENLGKQGMHNVKVITGDAQHVALPPGQKAGLGFAVFSLTHLSPVQRQAFFNNCRQHLLIPGAQLLIVDEFLPDWGPLATPTLHTLGHYIHHGNIIAEALRQGHFKTAALEWQAMWSGIQGRADFKTSTRLFEAELKQAGLRVTHKQQLYPAADAKTLVPVTESGVYAYTLAFNP